jgi:hypothetical protein
MKNFDTDRPNTLIILDKATPVLIKIILLCSVIIVGCEFYILMKL